MTKFRTALLTLTVAFTIAGGTGAASNVDAKSPINTVKGGDSSWCC